MSVLRQVLAGDPHGSRGRRSGTPGCAGPRCFANSVSADPRAASRVPCRRCFGAGRFGIEWFGCARAVGDPSTRSCACPLPGPSGGSRTPVLSDLPVLTRPDLNRLPSSYQLDALPNELLVMLCPADRTLSRETRVADRHRVAGRRGATNGCRGNRTLTRRGPCPPPGPPGSDPYMNVSANPGLSEKRGAVRLARTYADRVPERRSAAKRL